MEGVPVGPNMLNIPKSGSAFIVACSDVGEMSENVRQRDYGASDSSGSA